MAPPLHARSALPEGPFDLAVIGGGINGAAIARDAALRGKSFVLVEKDDFGAGTSSRTSKMAHGGMRYLEQLRIGLVYESLRERHYLLRNAPHLVRPQTFVLPVYRGARHGPRMIGLGLFLYDKLALGRRPGVCRLLGRDETLARVPALLESGLEAGGLYYDGVMDDARLVLANAVAAAAESGRGDGFVRNYTRLVRLVPGSPHALTLEDRVTGQQQRVLAHAVVRALGPWTDPARLVPSKGVHLVLPPLPMGDGLLLNHSRDGRVFFVIPWLGRTIVGTTETAHDGSPDNLRVEPGEVSYLLDEVRRVLPGLNLSRGDILGTFAGVRPLARSSGLLGAASPGAVARNHRIETGADGVVDVFGGKYTTYRGVAEQVVSKVFPGTTCHTHSRPLAGGAGGTWEEYERALAPELARLDRPVVRALHSRYGSELAAVLARAAGDASLLEPLVPGGTVLRVEVVHGVLAEHVIYPEDFLARRTKLRFTADGGMSAYDAVEALIRAHAASPAADLPAARERYAAEIEWEKRLRV